MSDTPVTAVILAAGEGRRLEPLTNRRPKPMVPVANRPLLEHVVEAVADTGIERIVLVVGYKQERIRNHFGDGDDWGATIEYVEQSTQLGTGHAVLQAEPVVDGPFVVLNGDRIVDPGVVSQLCDRAREEDLPAMAVTTVANPRQYGVVTLDGDRVTDIEEKPEGTVETNQINAGVYAFSPAVFDAIRETHATGELAITTTLDRLASAEPLSAVRYGGRWLDVSNLWDLLTVNAALIGDDAGAGLDDDALDRSVTVAADSMLVGETAATVSAAVLAIHPADGALTALPESDRPFESGDTIHVLGRPDVIRQLEAWASTPVPDEDHDADGDENGESTTDTGTRDTAAPVELDNTEERE